MKDRTSPAYWVNERKEFQKYAAKPLRHFHRFAARFRGDYHGVPYAALESAEGDCPGLANMTHLATRVLRSDLYFRNPRFQVRPPSLNRTVFTPLLAKIESALLQDWAEETNLYRHVRRALLDACLGPYGILKTTFSCDIAADVELIESERAKAQLEDQKFLALAIKPRVKDTDAHEVHIEQHSTLLAAAERGEIELPESALRYVKKHIKMHQESIPWSRPTETARNQSVHTRRIHPRNYSFDPWNDDPANREWFCERFIVRKEDVLSNPDYSAKAKAGLQLAKTRFEMHPEEGQGGPARRIHSSDNEIRTFDEHVVLYEVLDRVKSKKILYAENCPDALEVSDWTLGNIIPSGPYTDFTFIEDVDEGFGVCIPYIYEAHQEALSMTTGVNIEVVRRSPPKIAYDAKYVDTPTADSLSEFEVAGIVKLKNLPQGMKPQDVFGQVEVTEIPAQNVMMEDRQKQMIQAITGMGAAKLGAGDTSKTATASSLVSDATSTLAEDSLAVLDNAMASLARIALRHMRATYPQSKVYEIVGDDALQPGGWPKEGFAMRDILMDRGVTVIPGSSRRNDSAIEAKNLQEAFMAVAPLTGTLVPPELTTELLRRYMEANGVYGLDYEGMMQYQTQQAMLQGKDPMSGGAGDPEEQPGAEPGADRSSENTEPSEASRAQSAANVGGGRVQTGASRGDGPRKR